MGTFFAYHFLFDSDNVFATWGVWMWMWMGMYQDRWGWVLISGAKQSKKFFALPMEDKMLAPHPPGGSHHRGYSAPGLENASQHVFDAEELAKLRKVRRLPLPTPHCHPQHQKAAT